MNRRRGFLKKAKLEEKAKKMKKRRKLKKIRLKKRDLFEENKIFELNDKNIMEKVKQEQRMINKGRVLSSKKKVVDENIHRNTEFTMSGIYKMAEKPY